MSNAVIPSKLTYEVTGYIGYQFIIDFSSIAVKFFPFKYLLYSGIGHSTMDFSFLMKFCGALRSSYALQWPSKQIDRPLKFADPRTVW